MRNSLKTALNSLRSYVLPSNSELFVWALLFTLTLGASHYLVRQEKYADCVAYHARTGLSTELATTNEACREESQTTPSSLVWTLALGLVFARGLKPKTALQKHLSSEDMHSPGLSSTIFPEEGN